MAHMEHAKSSLALGLRARVRKHASETNTLKLSISELLFYDLFPTS
jgi:hypothetical protein